MHDQAESNFTHGRVSPSQDQDQLLRYANLMVVVSS